MTHLRRPRIRPRARWLLPPEPDPAVVARLQDELSFPPRSVVCSPFADSASRTTRRHILRPRLDQLHEPRVSPISIAQSSGSCARCATTKRFSSTATTTSTASARRRSWCGRSARSAEPSCRSFRGASTDGYDLGDAGVRAARGLRRDARRHVRLRHERARADRRTAAQRESTSSSPTTTCRAVRFRRRTRCSIPKRPGCPSPDKDLAAVGVAFKLALALTRAVGGNDNAVYGMLDLVALATIADVAPLRGENRVLVRYGLRAAERAGAPRHPRDDSRRGAGSARR